MDLTWRKSSHSDSQGGACVEVATLPGQVLIRDSKDPDGPRLAVPATEWRTFLRTLR